MSGFAQHSVSTPEQSGNDSKGFGIFCLEAILTALCVPSVLDSGRDEGGGVQCEKGLYLRLKDSYITQL
jgi:hypothetical protein